MKSALRIALSFCAFIAAWFFIFWVPFSLIPGVQDIPLLAQVVSALLAALIAFGVWKMTGRIGSGIANYIILGGVIVGAFGFIAGFFGPLIFMPESNQGPLLGLLFTGPVGFVLGLIGGAVYWKLRVAR
jgi:hypothetical protein